MYSFSWNLENWEASAEKTKSLISIKLWYFHCLSHSLFYWSLQLDKSCFQKIDLYKLNAIPRGMKLIDINYLKLCNTLLQIWCTRCYKQFVVFGTVSAAPYYNYSLLCILLLDKFYSTIWNLVEHALPCSYFLPHITIRYYISYNFHEVLLIKLYIVEYNYGYCKKYCWLYQLLLSLKYFLWDINNQTKCCCVLAVLYCNA